MTAQPAANILTHFAALPLNQAAIRHEVMDAVHEAMAASVRSDGSPAPAKHTCIPWKDALHIHYQKISNAGLSPASEEAAQYRLVEMYAALEAVDEELKKTIKGGLLGAKQLSE